MSKGWGDPEMSEEPEPEGFVSQESYDILKQEMLDYREQKLRVMDERDQLREALQKMNAGIHKASDELEGIIETTDQNMITNLTFALIKKHPKKIRIRYKGSEWKEIFHE